MGRSWRGRPGSLPAGGDPQNPPNSKHPLHLLRRESSQPGLRKGPPFLPGCSAPARPMIGCVSPTCCWAGGGCCQGDSWRSGGRGGLWRVPAAVQQVSVSPDAARLPRHPQPPRGRSCSGARGQRICGALVPEESQLGSRCRTPPLLVSSLGRLLWRGPEAAFWTNRGQAQLLPASSR